MLCVTLELYSPSTPGTDVAMISPEKNHKIIPVMSHEGKRCVKSSHYPFDRLLKISSRITLNKSIKAPFSGNLLVISGNPHTRPVIWKALSCHGFITLNSSAKCCLYVSLSWVIIGLNNCFVPVWHQAFIRSSDGSLPSAWQGTDLNEIII